MRQSRLHHIIGMLEINWWTVCAVRASERVCDLEFWILNGICDFQWRFGSHSMNSFPVYLAASFDKWCDIYFRGIHSKTQHFLSLSSLRLFLFLNPISNELSHGYSYIFISWATQREISPSAIALFVVSQYSTNRPSQEMPSLGLKIQDKQLDCVSAFNSIML